MPYSRLFYHFVWTTKRRLPLITDARRQPIFAAVTAKVKELNGIVHAVNAVTDHLHLVVTVPPTLALSAFVAQVKGISSYVAAQHTDDNVPFAWQAEYAVLTVSESNLEAVIEYVKRQQEHHAIGTLNNLYERLS